MSAQVAGPARLHSATGPNAKRRAHRSPRQFQCDHCSKIFKRHEHCVRHERAHTLEKPFSCRYCHKSYARKDLVTRHERTLHAERTAPTANDPLDRSASETSQSERGEDDQERLINVAASSPSRLPLTRNLIPQTPASPRGSNESTRTPGSEIIVGGHHSGSVTEEVQAVLEGLAIPTPRSLLPTALANSAHTPQMPLFTTQQSGNLNHKPDRNLAMAMDSGQQQQQHDNYKDQNAQLQQFQWMQPSMTSQSVPDFTFSPLPDGIFDMTHEHSILQVPEWLEFQNPSSIDHGGITQSHYEISCDSLTDPPPTLNTSNGKNAPFDSTSKLPRILPLLLDDKPSSTVTFIIDPATHVSITRDLAERLKTQDAVDEIPPPKIYQSFLASYVECFHPHLPFIHLATLCLDKTPSPLLLAMCSIGALYRLDRRRAQSLYDIARRSVMMPNQQFSTSSWGYPLWLVQARLLLTLYAVLSDDTKLVAGAMEETGFYTLVYERVSVTLAEESPDYANMTWQNWAERESWKRLLGAIFLTRTMSMVIYDVNPGFGAVQDLDIETFHDEDLWNARTPSAWQQQRATDNNLDYRTMKSVLADIMSENPQESKPEPYHLSSFSALFVMHAVVVQMWQALQVADTFARPSSTPALGQDLLRPMLLNTALAALARCHELLKDSQARHQEDLNKSASTSLLFNCQAILRVAYIRLFKAATGFNRLHVLALDTAAAEASVSAFATSKQERSPHLLKAVEKSFEAFRTPVQMGYMLVRKTAAFRWSMEHAVAGWDCALFVTRWVHSVEIDALNGIEPSAAEQEVLASIRHVLEETDYDPTETNSLAAALAISWSWFLRDVWVWGVTPRMGAILGQLAIAYERVNKANRRPW